MAKLWEPNPEYERLIPITLKDWQESLHIEKHIPYKRLYRNLNQSQLSELIQAAYENHWEALDLRFCGLDFLPEKLGELPELRYLALGNWGTMYNGRKGSENQLHKLFESIGNLGSLQSLEMLGTDIETLPESIGKLSHLRSITLENAGISALPNTFAQIASLQTLWLEESKISILPESLGQLSSLQTLGLHYSKITALPESIGQLSNLQELYLQGTQITTLPQSIGQLSNLKTLNLSRCHLQSIPYVVVKLGLPFVTNNMSAEDCVNLTHVTLDEGDLSLFDQPPEVIEAYYRNRVAEEEAEKRVNECKVIFLGDGSAGKSSLIKRIMHDDFKPGSLPTDGVKMTKWSEYADGFPLTLDGKPLTIRFLDFGGQEIMHSMHRCFLTTHTIYVVVCESRDDAEIDNVAIRWMETVKAFAPDCPVLLALNKVDVNPHVTINERTLRESNPKYLHTLHTSAATGQGVQHLIEDILAEVPGCLQKMNGNRDWLGLKQELENMDVGYILPEDLRARCDRFNIPADLRTGVLNWFQDLGVAYPYQITLQKIYVLNPAWLTNGIYRLILRAPGGGFLKHSDILETLSRSYSGDISDETYTEQEMAFILHIMRKFEISLYLPPALGNGDEMEMIPMKLDKTPPDRYDDFPKSGALHLRWEAGYLPSNLIHRLMIRKYAELDPDHAMEDKCVWRTGGWFRSTDGGWEALAEMTDRALDVYVRGARDARIYLDGFRQQIQQILGQLGIAAKEWIYYEAGGHVGRVLYEDVMKRRRRGKKEIYFGGDIDEDVSIETLLDTNYVAAGEDSRDFFISYNNTRDGARAAWIARTLTENGYTVHFQGTDCLGGERFAQWMADALASSRGFIAVWSSAYEASGYCKNELNAAFVRSHKDSRYFLLPVRVEDTPIENPLFQEVVRVDLLSCDEAENRENLLYAAEQIRRIR